MRSLIEETGMSMTLSDKSSVLALAERSRCWKMFSGLAWRDAKPDFFLMALALGWTHELCYGDKWVFCLGVRGYLGSLKSALKRSVRGIVSRRVRAHAKSERFDVLLVPVFPMAYYCAPCLALGRAIQEADNTLSVAIVKPADPSPGEFEEQARSHGFKGEILELYLAVPVIPVGALVRAASRFLKLMALREPRDLAKFFRAHPFSRFRQVLSNEMVMDRIHSQLTQWKVRKLITMNEQHFPSNLLVAAANELGIETHQILHGGIASPLYVPFQSQYLWPEYAFVAQQLEQYGADISRLKVVPGLQVASQIDPRRINGVTRRPCRDGRHKLLILAQYHGYSKFGIASCREALTLAFQAIKTRQKVWEVVVRPHPRDSAEDSTSMQAMLNEAGLDGVISDPTSDLLEEAGSASLVVTGASTAIFAAIALGTPACLIWGPAEIEAHGSPPLSEEWIVRTVEDLIAILDRIARADEASSFAEEQARKLGLVNLLDAPRRFCHALFTPREGEEPAKRSYETPAIA